MPDITLNDARALAEEWATQLLDKYKDYPEQPILESKCIETKEFFIFLRNKDIKFPDYAALVRSHAYAIPKRIYKETTRNIRNGKRQAIGIPDPRDFVAPHGRDEFKTYIDNIEMAHRNGVL